MSKMLKYIFFFVITSILAGLISCGAESRHKFLSTIFDGVPEENQDQLEIADTSKVVVSIENESTSKKSNQPTVFFHDPYQEKECDSCHDPDNGFVLLDPEPDLCNTCHDDYTEVFENLHDALDGEDCTSCHNPHKSENKMLLKQDIFATCFECHDQEELAESETHYIKVTMECTSCHNPHGGNREYYLIN